MVDALVGKWTSDSSRTVGLKEFLEAIGRPADDELNKGEFLLEISKNGDEWTINRESGGKVVFKVVITPGQKTTQPGPEGGEIEIEARIEGEKWLSSVNAKAFQLESVMYIENGELVQEQTSNGVSMVSRFSRAE